MLEEKKNLEMASNTIDEPSDAPVLEESKSPEDTAVLNSVSPEEQLVMEEGETDEQLNALEGNPVEEDASEQKNAAAVVVPKAKEPEPDRLYGVQRLVGVIVDILPVLIFIASVVCVGYYIIFPSRGEFHADCTDTLFWAYASYDSGHIFSESFHYACLLPFGGNLLMQLFMPIFGVSMTTHILGMLAFFVLFITFFCLMMREMHCNYRHICISAAILLMIISGTQKMREIFWGHIIYYSLGVLFIFIGLFLLFRLRNLAERKALLSIPPHKRRSAGIHYYITLAVFLVFFMLACTNRISSLTIFGLPLLAGIFAEFVVDSKEPLLSRRSRKNMLLLIAMAIMLVLGMKLCGAWAGDIVAGYEEAYSTYSDKSEWLSHAQGLPMAWLELFGVQNLPGVNIMSDDSIRNLIRMFAAILIAVVPIIATICYPKYEGTKGSHMRVCIWLHWAVTALILVGWICGLLSVAVWRLSPVIATSTMITLLFFQWTIRETTSLARLSGILMIPILSTSLLNAWDICHMPYDKYKDSVQYQLADYLEENDLTYGYASFWYANSLTVVSDDAVKVRNVNIDETGVTPYLYQTNDKWYEAQEGQDRYFLLLTREEYDTLRTKAVDVLKRAVQIQRTETTDGGVWYIFIYTENIF